MALTVAPSELAKRIRQCKGIANVALWTTPFDAVLFQQAEQTVMQKNLKGFVSGSNFDLVFYRNITK